MTKTSGLEIEPRLATIAAIDDLLFTTRRSEAISWYDTHWEDWHDLIKDARNDVAIAHDIFSTYVEEDHRVATFDLGDAATLEITKDQRLLHFLGRTLRPKIRYTVIAEYTDLAWASFPVNTSFERAPNCGYARWDFDTRRPKRLDYYHRHRRYDHYEESGGEGETLNPHDDQFNREFGFILEVVGQAKTILERNRNKER